MGVVGGVECGLGGRLFSKFVGVLKVGGWAVGLEVSGWAYREPRLCHWSWFDQMGSLSCHQLIRIVGLLALL